MLLYHEIKFCILQICHPEFISGSVFFTFQVDPSAVAKATNCRIVLDGLPSVNDWLLFYRLLNQLSTYNLLQKWPCGKFGRGHGEFYYEMPIVSILFFFSSAVVTPEPSWLLPSFFIRSRPQDGLFSFR